MRSRTSMLIAVGAVLTACADPSGTLTDTGPTTTTSTGQSAVGLPLPFCQGAAGPALVFGGTTFEGANVDLYSVEPEGIVRQLTDDGKSGSPSFSNDGKTIIFARAASRAGSAGGPPPTTALWTLDSASGEFKEIYAALEADFPSLSSDGSAIAFSGVTLEAERDLGSRIFTLAAAGGEAQQLITDVASDFEFYAESEPVWSSESDRLAFIRNGRDSQGAVSQVWVATPSNGTADLAYEVRSDLVFWLEWSWSGSELLFSQDGNDDGGREAVSLNLSSREAKVLAEPVSGFGAVPGEAQVGLIYFTPPDDTATSALFLSTAPQRVAIDLGLEVTDIVPTSRLDVSPCGEG